jgi:hypothetical protein
MTTRWEYRTLKIPTKVPMLVDVEFNAEQFDRVLNELGSQGWELVSVSSLHREGATRYVMATLKRLKG